MIFRQLNPHSCWTYLIADERSREAAIIDPVLDHVQDYAEMLEKENLKLKQIVDTHTHADHISGSAALKDKTHCEYLMQAKAAAACPTIRLHDGDKIRLADVPVKVLETPGHTKDSISLVLSDRILTGDALFLDDGGAGRDDLPGGDPAEHWDSLQKILSLPGSLVVYPAHEYRHRVPSSLEHQKVSNPHLKARSKEEFIRYIQDLKLGPADWMKDVLKANYSCARDPKAAWIPVDVPACEVKGTMSLGANDIMVTKISCADLQDKIAKNKTPFLLDVRDPDELIGELGSIEGVLNIPVAQLSKRLNDLEAKKNMPIVTICRSGGRAHTAAQILLQAGFKQVQVLDGGMTAFTHKKAK